MICKNEKEVILIKAFLSLFFVLVLTPFVLGLGITYYTAGENLYAGGEEVCVEYYVFNSGSNGVYVRPDVSSALKDLFVSKDTRAFVPAGTSLAEAVKVPVCFRAASNYPLGGYKGIVTITSEPQGEGTAVSVGAGAPLELKVGPLSVVDKEDSVGKGTINVLFPTAAVILIILIIIVLIVRSKIYLEDKKSSARSHRGHKHSRTTRKRHKRNK